MLQEHERRDITRKQHLMIERTEAPGLEVALFLICKLQFSGISKAHSLTHPFA